MATPKSVMFCTSKLINKRYSDTKWYPYVELVDRTELDERVMDRVVDDLQARIARMELTGELDPCIDELYEGCRWLGKGGWSSWDSGVCLDRLNNVLEMLNAPKYGKEQR